MLDTADDKAHIAVQTTTREASSADAVATRLMLTDVDYLGRIKLRAESFAIPLDAPAHCNAGAFIELPAKPLLSDTPERRAQLAALARIPGLMHNEGGRPSEAAAQIVLDYALGRGKAD